MSAQFDEINKAAHYNQSPAKCVNCGHPIECIDIIQFMGLCLGNVFKYIWRHGLKPGISDEGMKDLLKAQYYLNREIKMREEGIERRRGQEDGRVK